MKKATYDTKLTDAQWAYLQPLLPKPAKRGRPPIDRRRIIEAILYLVKCGCPWRYLPADFPHWKTVYHVFRQWIANHCWVVIHDTLRVLVRTANGKRSRPTAAILDSQSVKSAGHGGQVGYDAAKRIKGRKRHLLVDTLGLILGLAVTPADTTERDGAQLLLGRVLGWFTWLRILWVDGGYTGEPFTQWVKGLRPKLVVAVVKRSDDLKGFKVLPHRWVVAQQGLMQKIEPQIPALLRTPLANIQMNTVAIADVFKKTEKDRNDLNAKLAELAGAISNAAQKLLAVLEKLTSNQPK